MSWSTFFGLLLITMGATLFGSVPVLFHRYLKASYWKWWESFGGGVMLSASFFSLFLPAAEILRTKNVGYWAMIHGALWGCMFILLANHFLHKITFNVLHRKAYLFVLAMGIHNIPEGLAVGVDVGALGWEEAMPLCVAIFIQNFPEGLVSSMTFLVAGFSVRASIFANAITAVIEGVSALFSYSFVSMVHFDLAFLLSFAGACMSMVVIVEATNRWRESRAANFSLSGFIVGLLVCAILDLFL